MRCFTCAAAAVLGLVVGAGVERLLEAPQLASEKLAHAKDNEQYMRTLKTIADHDLEAQRKAMSEKALTQRKLEAMDAALTKERLARENIDRHYRNLISAGNERLYVRLRKDKPSPDDGASGTSGMGHDAPTFADIDPATAQRIFEVAGVDEAEIEKLRALQGYICTIRPHTLNCDAILK